MRTEDCHMKSDSKGPKDCVGQQTKRILGQDSSGNISNPFHGVDKSLVAEMQEEEMKFKAMHLIMRQLPERTATFRDAVLGSPSFPWLPGKMFTVSVENGAYDKFCRKMGRLLLERDQRLLSELIKLDVEVLRNVPNITARQAGGFYYFKYGLRNRGTISAEGWLTSSRR